MTRVALASCITFCMVLGWSQEDFLFRRKDVQKEIEVGRKYFDLAQKYGLISTNKVNANRVNRIFSGLIDLVSPKVYPYQLVVLGGELDQGNLVSTYNAGCYPGGFIVVHDALISLLQDDDELAMVLAHEIGHAFRRHAVRQASAEELDRVLASLSISVGGDPNVAIANINLSRLRYSRDMEREADEFGIQLFLKAGYDPDDASKFFEFLAEGERLSKTKVAEYSQTHPNASSRASFIRKYVANFRSKQPSTAEISEIPTKSILGIMPDADIKYSDFFPLRVGLEWIYEVQSKGVSTSYGVKVKSEIRLDLGSVFRMETRLDSNTNVSWQCFTTAEQVWRRNSPNIESSNWKVEFSLKESEVLNNGQLLSKRLPPQSVSTPFGTYDDALGIEVTDTVSNNSTRIWFAKNIGLIKRETLSNSLTEQLIAFKKPR